MFAIPYVEPAAILLHLAGDLAAAVGRSEASRSGPVARGNEPIARFQPALVLTSAQPSITRQLRAVHGSTGTSATAHASASARARGTPCDARTSRAGLRGARQRRSARNGAQSSACGRTSAPTPEHERPRRSRAAALRRSRAARRGHAHRDAEAAEHERAPRAARSSAARRRARAPGWSATSAPATARAAVESASRASRYVTTASERARRARSRSCADARAGAEQRVECSRETRCSRPGSGTTGARRRWPPTHHDRRSSRSPSAMRRAPKS